jgi:hypothetical protein
MPFPTPRLDPVTSATRPESLFFGDGINERVAELIGFSSGGCCPSELDYIDCSR